ncbi:MAG: bifunctional adenosylcobinamide kinase/adenosylcobinamide-phosphate guanylyltransferase [Thermodesulfobacteriota bacterium]
MSLVKEDKKRGFTLVLGGVRSGKSGFARDLCEEAEVRGNGRRVYLATAEALDTEMERRIERHRRERGREWATLEEPLEVAASLSTIEQGSVVLLDCLTLWLTNLMGLGLGDDEILERIERLARTLSESSSFVVVVSNDVGGGIMPENAMARRFADISGLMNQCMAASAEEVFLMTAGLPGRLK